MTAPPLATLDTAFIVASGICVIGGRLFIWRRRVAWHRATMLVASALALVFLVLYLVRSALYGPTPFEGSGVIRVVYFVVLIVHMIAATALPFLVAVTLYRAFRRRFAAHKRIARWTFPTWVFVALTGWLVYAFLYLI